MDLLPETTACNSILDDAIAIRMMYANVPEAELVPMFSPNNPSNSIKELLDDPDFREHHSKWYSATTIPHTDEEITKMVDSLLYLLRSHVNLLADVCLKEIHEMNQQTYNNMYFCESIWTFLDRIALKKQHALSIKAPCCGRPAHDFWCPTCLDCICNCKCDSDFEKFLQSVDNDVFTMF